MRAVPIRESTAHLLGLVAHDGTSIEPPPDLEVPAPVRAEGGPLQCSLRRSEPSTFE